MPNKLSQQKVVFVAKKVYSQEYEDGNTEQHRKLIMFRLPTKRDILGAISGVLAGRSLIPERS